MSKRPLTQFLQRDPIQGKVAKDGSLIKEKDPAKYECVVRAIKEGFGAETVARVFGMGHQTVSGIMRKEGLESDAQASFIQRLTRLRDMTAEALEEALRNKEVKGSQLGVSLGIIVDKLRDLEGRPTATIRHESIDLTHDTVQELLKQIPKRADVIEAEVVDQKS